MYLWTEVNPMSEEKKTNEQEKVVQDEIEEEPTPEKEVDKKEPGKKKTVKEKLKDKINEKKEPSSEEVIASLQEEMARLKNDVARAYADTENMKKRLQKEADTAKKYRFQQAGLELLPILDNMGMALNVQSESEELKNYVKGFEMIYQQLQRVLENEGVKEIEADGKPFDHNTMQALMQEKQEGVEAGIVLEVMQKGYMLKDRILRPALVKVSE